MNFIKTKKIIALGLLVSQITFWPAIVFAQIGTNVPVYDSNNGNNVVGGPAGVAQNTGELAALTTAFKTVYQGQVTPLISTGCLAPVLAAEAAYAVGHFPASTTAVISPKGNSALIDAMTKLDTAYLTYMICAGLQLGQTFAGVSPPFLVIANLPASSAYTSGIKQSYLNQINNDLNNYTKKHQSLAAQLDSANQGFWKTLLISMLLNTSKAVADALVSKLVNNYKISNLKQYADSAATLMYDNQFIRQNFPNAQDQLMARAILTNPTFRSQIQPGIFVAADAALGYNPAAINPASPNFYGQMAAMGSPSANPYYLQTAYVGGVDQSRAASLATAQQQINQGSGYKAPVNCAGSLQQQQQIDTQYQGLQIQLQNREALLANLTAAVAAGQTVKPGDLAKAQADESAAQLALLNAPQSVTSAAGSTSTDPAIIMCEAISSPAVLINQGIDAIFTNLGGQLTQYNSSNLPAFINTITGIASQIGSSMVLGGASAGAHAALVGENQAVAATVGLAAASQSASNGYPANNVGSDFITGVYPSGNNSSLLNWQVITSSIPSASYVTLTGGPGAPLGHQPLTGSATVSPTSTATYILTVFDSAGKSLDTTNINVFPSTQTSLNYNPSAPAVAGAFTNKPEFEPRGPLPALSIR